MVSQEYFDAIVKENIEEFEMDEVEAYTDACSQVMALEKTSNCLDFLFTTAEAKERSVKLSNLISKFNECIAEYKHSKEESLPKYLDASFILQLTEHCKSKAELLFATEHGLIGAIIYVITLSEKLIEEVSYWKLLGKLMCCDKCKDVVPKEGIIKLLVHLESNISAVYLQTMHKICKSNERNKQLFFDNGIISVLTKALDSKDKTVVSEGCKMLSELVTDNDRRPGIHPNTFIRGRKLAEHRSNSFIIPLMRLIAEAVGGEGDNEHTVALFNCLRKLLINDKACSVALSQKLVEVSPAALKLNDTVKSEVLECLAALGKNDDAKLAIAGEYSTLLPILTALFEERLNEPILTSALLKIFATITMRQPDICLRLFEHKVMEHALALMTYEADKGIILKEVMSLMRNMISSHETKTLVDFILDQGVESKIRLAQNKFPLLCNDPAYSLLRELGLQYC